MTSSAPAHDAPLTSAAFRVVPVSTLDPAQTELAEAWQAVFIDSAIADMGDDHDAWSMDSRKAREQDADWENRYFAALDGTTVIASAELMLPMRDNPHLAMVDVVTRPEHRRRGVGSLLLAHLIREAAETGRTSLLAETTTRPNGTDAGEVFLRKNGFDLGQTLQRNDLDVAAYAGGENPTETPGYIIETSTDDTLDEWLEDRAVLQQRMSTDAPIGNLDISEETWDADRLRRLRDTTRRSNRRAIESVARHVDSGRLVAFSGLQIPANDPSLAYQQDTLVLREHRGHGLGAAVKAANMRALRAEFPQTRTVRTWNAEENGPMIRVNEALGYRTTALQREWQKRLT
ncbi:hypothetical protein N802_15670 [Knoellia sinensis KCTC 19936]|uniref:N-acetyltransferase domain-containing protein n=1 Tax=Knoellia sinensis KCTC 19936 TaxID=1385520 RepID=A0A0A0J6R6_9MICO|nr:GNAT family N-acetyltransferase [Knoellia sinensis]KGN33010.1 hypothetical protein N802_15670 [Knoellia sinensis KCTC 19936]